MPCQAVFGMMVDLPLMVGETVLGSMVELSVVCAAVKLAARSATATEDLTSILIESVLVWMDLEIQLMLSAKRDNVEVR
jgi:hypothetical protein